MSGGVAYGNVAGQFHAWDAKISDPFSAPCGFRCASRPGCSMSPGAFAAALALPAVVTMGIGIGFAALGGWGILPFAFVETAALGLAFLAWARRAPGGRLHASAARSPATTTTADRRFGIGKG